MNSSTFAILFSRSFSSLALSSSSPLSTRFLGIATNNNNDNPIAWEFNTSTLVYIGRSYDLESTLTSSSSLSFWNGRFELRFSYSLEVIVDFHVLELLVPFT